MAQVIGPFGSILFASVEGRLPEASALSIDHADFTGQDGDAIREFRCDSSMKARCEVRVFTLETI